MLVTSPAVDERRQRASRKRKAEEHAHQFGEFAWTELGAQEEVSSDIETENGKTVKYTGIALH